MTFFLVVLRKLIRKYIFTSTIVYPTPSKFVIAIKTNFVVTYKLAINSILGKFINMLFGIGRLFFKGI